VLFKGSKSVDRRTEVDVCQQVVPKKQRHEMQSEKVKFSDTCFAIHLWSTTSISHGQFRDRFKTHLSSCWPTNDFSRNICLHRL